MPAGLGILVAVPRLLCGDTCGALCVLRRPSLKQKRAGAGTALLDLKLLMALLHLQVDWKYFQWHMRTGGGNPLPHGCCNLLQLDLLTKKPSSVESLLKSTE